MLRKKKSNIHFFLSLLLVIFSFLTYLNNTLNFKYFYGELGIVEITQGIILFLIILITLKLKSKIINFSNKLFYYTRLSLFSLLFYEEISFLSTNIFTFLIYFNKQSELNLHNSNLLINSILIKMSFLGLSPIEINLYLVGIVTILIVFGFGNYLPFFKGNIHLFLDKKLSLYSLIYPLNIVISYALKNLYGLDKLILDIELVELFMYIIFFIDISIKTKLIKI